MPYGWKNVKNVYRDGEDKKCVVWLYPYRSYDIVGKLKYWTKHTKHSVGLFNTELIIFKNFNQKYKQKITPNRKTKISEITLEDLLTDDASLTAKMMESTARPKVIREVAAEFTNKVLGVNKYF